MAARVGVRMGFGAKVLAGALVVALVPLGVVAFRTSEHQRHLAMEDAFERLEGLASVQLARIGDTLGRDRAFAESLADRQDVVDLVDDGVRNRLGDVALAQAIEPAERVTAATLLDEDGRTLARTDPGAPGRVRAIGAGGAEGDAGTGRVVASADGGLANLTWVPVVVGGRTGRLVIECDLTPISAMAANYEGLSGTGETSLAQRAPDGGAQFIAPLRFRPGAELAVTVPPTAREAPIIRAIRGEEGRIDDAVDYRDESVLAVTRQVDGAAWALVVKIDRDEALASVTASTRALLAALAAAILVAAVGAVLFSRWVRRPVRAVTAASAAVARGDLSRRAPVRGRDELADLAVSVNTMTDHLVNAAGAEAERSAELTLLNQRLAEREQRLAAIFEAAEEAILNIDAGGRVIDANPAAATLLGRRAPLTGLAVDEFLCHGDRRPFSAGDLPALAERGSRGVDLVAERPDASDGVLHVIGSRIEASSGATYTVLMRDVSERLAYEHLLTRQATHDVLTGLPNRAELTVALRGAVAGRGSAHRGVAALFADIDRFKVVNDSLGHGVGDQLLASVADRLREAVGEDALVARFGGDEFVVLVEECPDPAAATALAERMLVAVRPPFSLLGQDVPVSLSIGVVHVEPGQAASADGLLANADLAMYQAKQAGGDRHVVFRDDMRRWIESRHRLEVAIRHACDEREFEMAYQPVIDLRDGRVIGAEALARWDHRGQSIAPGQFIPLAEETGVLIELGTRMLRDSLAQLAQWRAAGHRFADCFLSVNVGTRQLVDPSFAEVVVEALSETGIDADSLWLEITETALLSDVKSATVALRELRSLGLHLSVDDFGTGYSSLPYIRRFSLDML
ncbi:MAG: EAL domain-containing protein, partial [Acidimicrobiales bacterium]|nr:EAL domain-containing protein [Acidimicrobiales bacterium]